MRAELIEKIRIYMPKKNVGKPFFMKEKKLNGLELLYSGLPMSSSCNEDCGFTECLEVSISKVADKDVG